MHSPEVAIKMKFKTEMRRERERESVWEGERSLYLTFKY